VSGARLVHGLDEELVAADWPAITLDEVRPVLAELDLPARAVTWQSPRPLSAAALVNTGDRTVFVKRHSVQVRTPAGLAEEHGFARHLRACGVAVPEVLRTSRGGSVVRRGGWTWEVHEHGQGSDLYRETLSWRPFRSVAHAFSAGATLAALATAGASYDPPARSPQPLVTSWTAIRRPDLLEGLCAFVGERPRLLETLSRWDWKADVARDFAALHASLAPLLPHLPEGWTHGDGHASNLLWSDSGEVSAVLDLGLSDRTTPVLDLATALERNAVSWLDPEPRVHTDIVDALVHGWASVRGGRGRSPA
jgi:Ser/Thr protein kinase RdoA (MazF antagonist)